MSKKSKVISFALLATLLMIAVQSAGVNAQSQGSINMLSSIGGTTDPAPGTTSYNDGTTITLTATPDSGSVFQYWIISTTAGSSTDSANPTTLPAIAGITYDVQAVFQPIQAPVNASLPAALADAAIVVVLSSSGGTTSPAPGTYAFANATSLTLTAKPDQGWTFDHWVIAAPTGSSLSHGPYPFNPIPNDNPYTVDHGYGGTYSYQAVFAPTSAIPEFSPNSAALIAFGLVIATIAFGLYAVKRKK
jgi:hypothetical protein